MTSTHPRLRSSIAATHDGSTLFLTALAEGTVHEYDVDIGVAQLVRELDGCRTVEDLRAQHGAIVDEVIAVLRDDGLLTEGRAEHLHGRWSNQLRFLAEAGDPVTLHDRLRRATVAVIGIGGVGTWVCQGLASAGIGSILAIDPDVVEESNLNRQVMYGVADVGSPKVRALQQSMQERFPETALHAAQVGVREADDLLARLAGVDLVISCADEPDVVTVSGVVADAAQHAGVPAIVGGGYGAAVGAPGITLLPGASPCWRCVVASSSGGVEAPMTDVTPAGPSAGSFGPLVGITGMMTAWEACRILLELESMLSGHIREFDSATLRWREIEVSARPTCGCVAEEH